MARPFRRGSAAISQKRLTSWFTIATTATVFTATGGTLLTSLTAGALALRPFTIVRTRLTIAIETDQVIATERQWGAYGQAVVSDQASAVGITAVPTPVTDADSDLWFVHRYVGAGFRFLSGVGAVGSAMRVYEIDSKAMRKVDIGQDVVSVGEFDSGASSAGFTMIVSGRQLIKVN